MTWNDIFSIHIYHITWSLLVKCVHVSLYTVIQKKPEYFNVSHVIGNGSVYSAH